jgi:hypothetical protein
MPWPDTTATLPPRDHPYASAVWLLGRHRQLADLVDRLPGTPGVAVLDEDGAWLDLDLLAEALIAVDEHAAAWVAYRARRREPRNEVAWQAWHDAGPAQPDTPAGRVAAAIACMSGTEQVRLRLLACFAPDGARFAVGMLTGFDQAGQHLICDWLEAIRHA